MQSKTKAIAIAVLLALLMAATRSHHFGSAISLPDASLAVFFLAGFYLARWRAVSLLAFGALLLEAGGIDYYAITYRGVSDWCVTPAYWFLIPTYAVMMAGGRWLAARAQNTVRGLGLFAAASVASTSVAFLISNGSFHLFSGRYADLSLGRYVAGVAKYYPPYLGYSLMYLAIAVVVHLALTSLHKPAAVQQ